MKTSKKKAVVIIPARFASTRFPGKPLVDMNGKPMIQRVYEQASLAVDEVWVATDDERIFSAVQSFGGKVVMTSANHASGTDRICEAYEKIGIPTDVVINVQGDEPFVRPEQIQSLANCFIDSEVQIATLATPFAENDPFDTLFNPNQVKVIFNLRGDAIYFSRAILPYVRGHVHTEWLHRNTFYKHIGMYAYRPEMLRKITELPKSGLEEAENLEQLRWIENGFRIRVATTDSQTIGIDTPEDMERALHYLADIEK